MKTTRRTVGKAALAKAALTTLVAAPVVGSFAGPAAAQTTSNASGAQDFLLTIFLRHDENKTLGEINEHLKQTGFFKRFPPEGIEVVSWYVMMGIGQVVTLKVPPARLREVNRILEETAWGGFHTEFYPTYDYRQGAADIRKAMQ